MIAAVTQKNPTPWQYRCMDPESMHLGELFELHNLTFDVAQLRKVDELSKLRSYTREYFDAMFIEAEAANAVP